MTSRTPRRDPRTAAEPSSAAAPPTPEPPGRQLPLPHVALSMVGLPRIPGPPLTGVPGRVLWWGGLAAVAAVGVLDWPVAAAIAAGSYVAERRARAATAGSPALPTGPAASASSTGPAASASPTGPTPPPGGDEEDE